MRPAYHRRCEGPYRRGQSGVKALRYTGCMNGRHELESRREPINALCRKHPVARLLVFGSVLRDDFNPESSDIDLLVRFKPEPGRGWASELPRCRRRSKRCSFVMSIYCQRMGFVILTGCNPSSPQKNCCMSRSVDASLEDILHAAWSIELFTAGISFDTYCDVEEKRWATERGFEIMGEAASQALRPDPAFDELVPEARQMIAFRNVLIHDYAVIRDEQVWDTVKNKRPNLKARLATILAERKAKERAAAQ